MHFAKSLDFGRYRIEVAQAGGMAITSYRFRAGWASSDSPDVPDRVDVSADRKSVPVGQSVRIHIAPPFAGEATLLVLSDKVLASRTLSVPEGGATVDVPVEASWGPGAYVAVHVFRGGAGTRPGRALGLTWVGVDPAARTMAVSITVPDKTLPRGRLARAGQGRAGRMGHDGGGGRGNFAAHAVSYPPIRRRITWPAGGWAWIFATTGAG